MNSFGRIFRISIFGESHGYCVGVTIDGCPCGIPLKEEDFIKDMDRRRSGIQGTTKRLEPDSVEIWNGVYDGYTTGSPITAIVCNTNTNPKDYSLFKHVPRPGHADFTGQKKYHSFNDMRGGGHFSGRVALGLVIAGVIAKKILKEIHFISTILSVGGSQNISQKIEETLQEKDSVGGLVECRIQGCPIGWGEPFFDSIESSISHLVFAIPAIRGIEFGEGFLSASRKGSEHNDAFIDQNGKTLTNHCGGINGGITNGNEILFRVAVKPPSSIAKSQHTFDFQKNAMTDLVVEGRHDACIALRIPVIIEAAAAIALADFSLLRGHS